MTDQPDAGHPARDRYIGSLVPLLAFGSTLAGMALHNAGLQFEIQYAAAGGFLASCLLAYLAWTRLNKDIVALSTPIYGFVFLITPVDYTGGVAIQLIYACGLTLLTARLYHRFSAEGTAQSSESGLVGGVLDRYVAATRDSFAALDPEAGHHAAEVFVLFSEAEYRRAADLSRAASVRQGVPPPVARAFAILCQHAELLDSGLPCSATFLSFSPDDASLLAKPMPGSGDPDRAFETQMDNALLLLFSAGWHASASDRPSLLSSQAFAKKLLES